MDDSNIRARDPRGVWDKVKGVENIGILAIMAVYIIVVIALKGQAFLSGKNLTDLLRSVSVTGIMAVAVTLVMITANIDLSLGWLIGLCACVTGVHSDNLLVALLLAMLLGGLGGALNGFLVGGLKLNAFITTLGTMYVFKGITMLYANNRILATTNPAPALKFMGQGSVLGLPVAVWIFLVVAAIFWFILKRTTFGTKIFAVGANPIAARFSGISAKKTIFLAYTLGGLATGLAGVLFYSKVMATQAYSGAGLEFDVLTAIVLGGTSVTGGKGSIPGTLLGVIFVGVLSNGFNLLGVPSTIQYVAQGLILLVAIRADVMRTGGLK